MRTLYTFDKHNYSDDMEVFERFAVRAVIIRDGAGTGGARGGRASCRAGKHQGVWQGHRKETRYILG